MIFKEKIINSFFEKNEKYNLYVSEYWKKKFELDKKTIFLKHFPNRYSFIFSYSPLYTYILHDIELECNCYNTQKIYQEIHLNKEKYIFCSQNLAEALIKYGNHRDYKYKIVNYFLLEKKNVLPNLNTMKILDQKYEIIRIQDFHLEELLSLEKNYLEEETYPGETLSLTFVRQMLTKKIKTQPIWAVKTNGTFIAKIAINASGIKYKQIGGLYTHPQYRRQYLAQYLFQHVINIEKNYKLILFVKKDNHTAINLYHKLGFVGIGNISALTIKSNKL